MAFGGDVFGDQENERRSLLGEILDWMLVPLLVIWPLSIGLTFRVANEIADVPYDQAMIETLRAISSAVDLRDGNLVLGPAATARAILHADAQDSIYYQVRGYDGEVVGGDAEIPPMAPRRDEAANEIHLRDVSIGGIEYRVAHQFIRVPIGSEGPLLLAQVAETKSKRNKLASRIVTGVLVPQFAVIPLAVILVYLGLDRGVAPLRRLTGLVDRRRPADLTPLPEQGVPEEVLPLVHAFNGMLLRLEKNLAAQRRFIADAAHQMRTPLAGLKMQSELALGERDARVLRDSLMRIDASADRAAHLINQLLAMARAEASSDASHGVELVDINHLVTAVTGDLVPLALAKRQDIGVERAGGAILVEGSTTQLGEALKNLIDNAIKYAPVGGRITVRTRASHLASIEVDDDGPGIPPSERERVFERFYRATDHDTPGSGLGLSIVSEIVRLHRGNVVIGEPDSGRGTRVTLDFPRRRSSYQAPRNPGSAFPLA